MPIMCPNELGSLCAVFTLHEIRGGQNNYTHFTDVETHIERGYIMSIGSNV